MSNFYVTVYTKISGYEAKQLLSGRVPLTSDYSFIHVNDDGSIITIPDNEGAVVYTGSSLSEWKLKQKISTSNSIINSINGNQDSTLLVLGSRSNNSAFLYNGTLNTNYNLTHNLTGLHPNNLPFNNYGTSIAVNGNGNIVAIGEPKSTGAGSVFVYRKNINNQWQLNQRISGNGFSFVGTDDFGFSLDINKDGDVIAVGAPKINTVFIYVNSGLNWQFNRKITGRNVNDPNLNFGKKVVISEDESNLYINNSNSVDIYKGNSQEGWTFKQNLEGINQSVNGTNYTLALLAVSIPLETLDSNFLFGGAPACAIKDIINYRNTRDYPINLRISGSIDDDLLVNGVIYESGQYPYPWIPGQTCGYGLPLNGAHTITPLDINLNPGESVLLQGISYVGNLGYTFSIQSLDEGQLGKILIYNMDCLYDSYVTDDTKIVIKNDFGLITDINDSWTKNAPIFENYNYTNIFSSNNSAGSIINLNNDKNVIVTASARGQVFTNLDTGFSGYSVYFADYSVKNPYDPIEDYNKTKQQITIKQFKYKNTGYKATFAFDESWASFNLSGLMNADNSFSWNIKFLEKKTFSGSILYEEAMFDPNVDPLDIYKQSIPPSLSKQLVNYFESFQTVCQFKLGCDQELEQPDPGLEIYCWTGVSLEGRDFNNWLQENLQKTVDVLAQSAKSPENLLESVGVELYFTTLSGYILYNNWLSGEQIIWNLYNFDYPKIYKQWHLNNNPPYPSTGFTMTYPFDWNSIDSLVSGLNKRLDSPISYPVWYPYPCTSGEMSGVFIGGPLMRFWKNTGTTGDGLPENHVNNRIDFVSLRNLPQVTVKNEFLTRKQELFNQAGLNGNVIDTGLAIASTQSILDTAYQFQFVVLSGQARAPKGFAGFRYLLPKTVILEGLDKSTNNWKTLDTINIEDNYKNLSIGEQRIVTTLSGYVQGVLPEYEILQFEDTGKTQFEFFDIVATPTCLFRDLFNFTKKEQIQPENLYCSPITKDTEIKFVWPEFCPTSIISGSQVVEVDNVYWCNREIEEIDLGACEDPFVIYCPPGYESFLCAGECLSESDPCPFYTCKRTGLEEDSRKIIPITYTLFQTGSNFSASAGFNDINGDDNNIQLRCGEEISFTAYKEFRVRLINFFAAKDPIEKVSKNIIIRDNLLPLYLDNSFYVQNISFIDAKNVPFSGHIGEAECLIGSDYVVSVSGLTPLRFTGTYDVIISGQNSSGAYEFKNVTVGRKIEDEERFVKFNKVSGYINDESGFAFLRDTIYGSGKICYNFDNTPYFFYDPLTTIVSFEKVLCGDFFRTGVVSGTETIIKQSVINKELLAGGRFNIAVDFYATKENNIVNGTLTNTPYRAYNVTGIYNISGTATGIAQNGVLNVNIPSFLRPFN